MATGLPAISSVNIGPPPLGNLNAACRNNPLI
jgi:hypothetical protein